MTNTLSYPSYLDCVAEILGQSEQPLSVDTLVEQVKARRPVGKGARSAVYQAIGKLYQAVPVAPSTYGWLTALLNGQTLRHPLNKIEVQKGTLLMDELEHAAFFPEFFQDHQPDGRIVRLHLMGGPMLHAQASIEQDTWALRLGQEFVQWVDQAGGAYLDDLLIRILDAEAGEYSLRLQPQESRREEEITVRNLHLARTAEAIVSGDRKARPAMPVWELAASLVARGVYAEDTPPDDMHFVLHEHSNLRLYEDMGYAQVSRDVLRRERAERTRQGRRSGDVPPWLVDPAESESASQNSLSDDFLWDEPEQEAGFWDVVEDNVVDFSDMEANQCEGYQFYLSEFSMSLQDEEQLSHMDFHLLEAELETLVGLEQEFGYLMPEQVERKEALSRRLFIDPDIFYGGDWDQSDFGGPPFWDN